MGCGGGIRRSACTPDQLMALPSALHSACAGNAPVASPTGLSVAKCAEACLATSTCRDWWVAAPPGASASPRSRPCVWGSDSQSQLVPKRLPTIALNTLTAAYLPACLFAAGPGFYAVASGSASRLATPLELCPQWVLLYQRASLSAANVTRPCWLAWSTVAATMAPQPPS